MTTKKTIRTAKPLPDFDAEFEEAFAPRKATEAAESRVAELLKVRQNAMAVTLRYDIDTSSEEFWKARTQIDRVDDELTGIVVETPSDALAALRFVTKEIMADRRGEELGTFEVTMLNLLDGVAELLRQQAR
ncbi:hypothetical protein [Xanthobacter autotrophicus]|jgi:hypothetical protein|uniref:hypothetical protein n=1 Tax=Xanthobacter autotrophicus TaxID=280 RepID=UPI00372B46E7